MLFLGLGLGLTGWQPLEVVGLLGPAVWFLVAVHRFYRSGWVETVLKAALLGIVYFFLVIVTVLLTSIVALLGT